MKIFVDTNILLDIYHLSGPDLDELKKLTKMVQSGQVELLVSRQVMDEFWRNRERIIADAIKAFRESKAAAKIPNIIRVYPEANELKAAVDKANDIVRTLLEKANGDIKKEELKADKVICELFAAVEIGEITDDILTRARRRMEIGNPPGKPDSLGDAINWEWLLGQEVMFCENDEFVLISSDSDFESELVKGKAREFLLREWKERNPNCKLILEKSLTKFLQNHVPSIQLAEELQKTEAIERLESSATFASTHAAIARLKKYDDYTTAELERILNAYLENHQILWILGDDDVREYALKIITASNAP